MKWDASSDRLLLLAILESHNITVDYESVARNIGNGCSASAVYQQLLKIRKINRSSLTKKTPKKGGKGKVSFGDDDDKDIKNFKPRPFLQRKAKTEEEGKEVIMKIEKGQPEPRKGVQFTDIIIIDDDDDE